MSFTSKHPDPSDESGWELTCETLSEFEFKGYGHSRQEILAKLKTILDHFHPDFVRLTFYRLGPFVAPGKLEENDLDSWHAEEEDQPGIIIKWALKDATGYKFVEPHSLFQEISALINSGVTKLISNKWHGADPDRNAPESLVNPPKTN